MIDSKEMWEALKPIAKKHFDAETLETRNMDRLDFYDAPIWSIRDALVAAYMAGYQQGEIDTVNKRYGISTARPCDNCDRIFAPTSRNDHEQGWFCDHCLTNPEE